jgi:hypothetical protein
MRYSVSLASSRAGSSFQDATSQPYPARSGHGLHDELALEAADPWVQIITQQFSLQVPDLQAVSVDYASLAFPRNLRKRAVTAPFRVTTHRGHTVQT